MVFLPPSKRVVECKWLYNVKYKLDGTIERYKPRQVAKGFTQTEGLDFFETFAPVSKMATVTVLIDVAAIKGWTFNSDGCHQCFLTW